VLKRNETIPMVTGIYQQTHSVSTPVYNVQFVGTFIGIKQCLMPNYICIPYLSILQILKFTAAHTTQ
jgi:hypothetical protein